MIPRLGIVTPVLTMLPQAHATWEETGTFADVVRIAEVADALGFSHLTCSEHVAVPVDVAATRGARYWDPLATFGYLAARTATIRFETHVLVLGYHHPLAIAKRYGTLDQVSDGRVILGVGVGSLEEEFDLLDAPFTDRGPRADDAMDALRAAMGRAEPVYDGEYYAFRDWIVDPAARQTRMPMWVGGRSARSLRRAVEHGDGWAPFGLRSAEISSMLAVARDTPAWTERDSPLEVVLQTERPLDPSAEPAFFAERVAALQAAGATAINFRFIHHSVEHYCEQLAATVEVLASP